jgi:hypothetical protein
MKNYKNCNTKELAIIANKMLDELNILLSKIDDDLSIMREKQKTAA